MLSVEDWAEIRRLHRAERLPIKMIARVLGVSRNTVRTAIASDAAPKYERKPAGSIVDVVEPRKRDAEAAPQDQRPATVITSGGNRNLANADRSAPRPSVPRRRIHPTSAAGVRDGRGSERNSAHQEDRTLLRRHDHQTPPRRHRR